MTWSATLGSIDSNGNYTAPAVANTMFDSITATSVSNPTSYATASVTVNPASQGTALEYWVSPTGSDSNDGSQNHPWATIAHADSALVSGPGGVIVHVLPGAYTFGSFTTSASGTTSARIRFVSDQRWGAKLVNTGWYPAGNYSDIDGFDISNPGTSGGWDGIGISANYVHVTNNYIHNIGDNQTTACPQDGAIVVNKAYHDALVDSNVIYSTGKLGGHCNGTTGTSNHGIYIAGYHNIVTNNIISKAAGYGIELYHNPCQEAIANNTVFYNYTGGIQVASGTADGLAPCVSTGDAYTSLTNNIVVHNGWGCSTSNHFTGGIFLGMSGLGVGNRAYNNLLAGNLSQTSCSQINAIAVYSGEPVPAEGGNINHGSTYDDLFVNYHDEYTGNPTDYQPSPASAAVTAGTLSNSVVCAASPGISPCVPTADFNGVPLSTTTAPAIGALQVR